MVEGFRQIEVLRRCTRRYCSQREQFYHNSATPAAL